MGKHLVKSEKATKVPRRGKVNPAAVDENIDIEEEKMRKPFFIPRGFGKGLKTIIIPGLALAAIPFLPFESIWLKVIYCVLLLIAAAELIWDCMDSIEAKEYFAYGNVVLFCAVLAFVIGLELEALLIVILHRITKLIAEKIEHSAWARLDDLKKIVPDTATVETSEGILTVQAEYINSGDIIVVDAGERIPLDGVIIEGISTIDTLAVSGQSTALAVTEGHRVYSGCRNITSKIRVKVSRPLSHSTAKSIVNITESSTEFYSRQDKFARKIKKYFPLAMLISAAVVAIVLGIINGNWLDNISRAVILLMVSSSAAALSSVSVAYIKSIGSASEAGIFVKGADCIEAMAKAETMVFDKTGIITEGRYVITDVFPNKVSEQQLLSMAATAERFSKHPIAVVLRQAAGAIEIDYRALQIEEIPGRGISAFVGDKQVYVGNAALLEEHGIKCQIPSRSGAAIHVAVDYKYWGHILVTDRIRRGAFDSLENLRANGVKKLVLLTGDVLSVAKPLASKLNFDMLRAELKPSEKTSAVEFLMSNRGEATTLAFVGDGNSSQQIMSRVDVGIAMGALGSDGAFSFADVLIMDRDIKKLPAAIKLSRLCYRIALENLIVWLAVNALIIILGLIGAIPVIAALLTEFLMSWAVLFNSFRIK